MSAPGVTRLASTLRQPPPQVDAYSNEEFTPRAVHDWLHGEGLMHGAVMAVPALVLAVMQTGARGRDEASEMVTVAGAVVFSTVKDHCWLSLRTEQLNSCS